MIRFTNRTIDIKDELLLCHLQPISDHYCIRCTADMTKLWNSTKFWYISFDHREICNIFSIYWLKPSTYYWLFSEIYAILFRKMFRRVWDSVLEHKKHLNNLGKLFFDPFKNLLLTSIFHPKHFLFSLITSIYL